MVQKNRSSKKAARRTRVSQSTPAHVSRPSAANNALGFFQFPALRAFFSQRKNLILTLVVLVLLGLAYLLKDVFIVAVVNGTPIYRWTVVHRLEEQGGKAVLDSIVTETLVRQAIKKAGVQVNPAEIDAQLKEIEDRLSAQGLTLDQALAQEGLTREKLVEDITLQRSAEQLVADKVTVTDEEVDAYITDNEQYLPADLTGEALRSSVRQQLYSNKLSEAIQQWVEELHGGAQILYVKEYPATAF